MSTLSDSRVAVCRAGGSYPAPPFDPGPDNAVYAAVMESFRLLGFDPQDPLSELIRPGDRVLLKPNWVSERHHLGGPWEPIITHGSVLRPIIDCVRRALRGEGRIILADGPMLDSDFSAICRRSGVDALREISPLEVLDLRDILFETRGEVVMKRTELPGDPAGRVVFDLGTTSSFFGHRGEGRYYGADYDTGEVNQHHAATKHEYLLSKTAVEADVIIDVAKLKTHAKVGTTLALKGVVGLNAGRNWLPHHTQGTPDNGGDQFSSSSPVRKLERTIVRAFERASLRFPDAVPKVFRLAKAAGKPLFGRSHQIVRGGGWHGNDTLWRTVLDINRALTYGDVQGNLRKQPRRRLVVIDGIVAGEGTGPVFCDPVPAGLILAGMNPVAVDTIATEMMGFDFTKVPYLRQAYVLATHPLVAFAPSEIEVTSNVREWCGKLDAIRSAAPYHFAAPNGWQGEIERADQKRVA